MPSRPLSADQEAVVKLFTRLDVEAADISHGRTDIPAAVARLAQLVPPARLDLVEGVLVRVARRDLSMTLDGRRPMSRINSSSESVGSTLGKCGSAGSPARWST
jgi:hypothetical protein